MLEPKPLPMSFRVSERFRAALEAAADAEHRSQSNMLEVMVFDYCKRHGVEVPAKQQSPRRSKTKK